MTKTKVLATEKQLVVRRAHERLLDPWSSLTWGLWGAKEVIASLATVSQLSHRKLRH